MTVMCELHSMIKELNNARTKGKSDPVWQEVMRGDTQPLPEAMFDSVLDESSGKEVLKNTPKKPASRIDRSGGSGAFGAPGAHQRDKSSGIVLDETPDVDILGHASGLSERTPATPFHFFWEIGLSALWVPLLLNHFLTFVNCVVCCSIPRCKIL